MTPSEIDDMLTVLRKHGAKEFQLTGIFSVSLAPVSQQEDTKATIKDASEEIRLAAERLDAELFGHEKVAR